MKASEIQQIYTKLYSIRTKKLPIKMSFAVSNNLRRMEEIVLGIEGKRDDLLGLYAEKDECGNVKADENGNVRIGDPEHFLTGLNEVLNADVEIVFDRISMADMEKCDIDGYDSLTVDEVSALYCMIDDGDLQT